MAIQHKNSTLTRNSSLEL